MSPVRRAPVLALLRSVAVCGVLIAGTALPSGVAAAAGSTGTTVVGQLVQAWPEVEAGQAEVDAPISWVQNSDGENLRIPTGSVGGIPAGSTVRVTVGADNGGGTAEDPQHDASDAQVVAAAPADPVLRDQAGITNHVTVVRVAPDGAATDRVTDQQLVDLVDGPVASFWSEQSGGAISVGVGATVRDWVRPAAGCSDPTALWNEVATTVGFVPGPGQHLMLYISGADTTCSYALAEVGSSPATGGRLYVHDASASVIAHELGHNFGLGHSSGEQCDGAVESAACTTTAYRDYYDVMGVSWAQMGSLNVAQAARLGVLPTAQQQSLTVASGPTTVTLAPLSGRTGTRGLRLTGADGVDYWLEDRTATGRDAWLGTADNRYHLQSGVLLRRAGGLPDTSLLLDGTPSPAAGWTTDLQEALPVGTAVPVAGGDFTVVVQSEDANGAVLSVTPTPPAAARSGSRAVPPPAAGMLLPGSPAGPAAAARAPKAVPAPVLPAPAPAQAATRPLRATASSSSVAHEAAGPLPIPLVATAGGATALLLLGPTWVLARSRRRRRAAPARSC